MFKTSTKDVDGAVVTLGKSFDPKSDEWLVTGPYRAPDGVEGAAMAPSLILDSKEEAMEYAQSLVAMTEGGCEIVIFPDNPIPA